MTDTKRNPENHSALIVSYSYSGNTHRIARGIQEFTGGDRYEIYPLAALSHGVSGAP